MKILIIILCIALLFRNKREGKGIWNRAKNKPRKRWRNIKKYLKDQSSKKIYSL
jgi:uncharacterized membrane protein